LLIVSYSYIIKTLKIETILILLNSTTNNKIKINNDNNNRIINEIIEIVI